MTEVDVHPFYSPSHRLPPHLPHPLSSLDNMPDEVQSISRPVVVGGELEADDFLSAQESTGLRRPQDRGALPLCLARQLAVEPADENSNFQVVQEDGAAPAPRVTKSISSQAVTVSASENVAVSYQVRGLQPHEMPVIGLHVDSRIMPGFRYRVRIADRKSGNPKERYQFQGRALHLVRMGQGYGKRLTFEADSLNDNSNYFWSDSSPGGYGFGLVAVQSGDRLVLTRSDRRPIGSGVVEEASPCQSELSTEVVEGQGVVKRVAVIMKVRLSYTCERHGMRSLRADETVIVRGVARVVKEAGESRARTKCIEDIELPNLGECLLYTV